MLGKVVPQLSSAILWHRNEEEKAPGGDLLFKENV